MNKRVAKPYNLHCKPIPVMGFPCVVFPTGKNLFSSPGNPVVKKGFSLSGNTTQGKPCSGPVLALHGIVVYMSRLVYVIG
jgi:hypothetical protein